MRMRINAGRLIDPGRLEGHWDLLVADGRIERIVPPGQPVDGVVEREIDAAGLLVVPGLIDLHVHLREPGQEHKETIASGCLAAVSGGFTAVCCMPNTTPVNDCQEVTGFVMERAQAAGTARVYPVAAVSRGLEGKQLSEFGELVAAGAVAFSDDGRPVANSLLMRRALEYAAGFGAFIVSHCEELALAEGGAMNEGEVATRLGLPGIPNAAETIMVLRDIALCELTRARLHIAHVSCAESVAAIRAAKARGVPVSAETAPHYFTLTDEAVARYDTHAKMNPPLRSAADREAVCQGLADGTLDAIATDHAPHDVTVKAVEFDRAANGIIGLETALPLGLHLVEQGVLPLDALVARLATNPARILGKPHGLFEGALADITLIDPRRHWTYRSRQGRSLSGNTPFDGMEMTGRAVMTLVGGRIVFER
jgi:dihydroorotase